MDRKVLLPLLAIILLVLAAALLLPGGRTADPNPRLPWQISVSAEGQSEVFGLSLGRSTLADARATLNDQGKLTLFRSPEGVYAAEAFFQRASLSGLRADFVFALALEQPQAAAMFERGLRLSTLGSGVQKVELAPEDSQQLSNTPLELLTYIPSTDLAPELIQRHFGKPAQVLDEAEGISHWLYPERGLDIAVNPEGKEVLQYVQPRHFQRLLAPLQAAQPISAEG